MHAPRLPPEIISFIVDQVAVGGKGPWKNLKRDLKACSLANSLLLSLTRPHLFASISLSVKRAHRTAVDLKSTKLGHFPIAHYVKELRLTYAAVDGRSGAETLAAMLDTLHDLRSFCFRFDVKGSSAWDRLLPHVLQQGINSLISRSPGLARFETDMIAFPSEGLITTNLQHLVLKPLPGTQYPILARKWESFLEQGPFLKTLNLSGDYEPMVDDAVNAPEESRLTQLEILTLSIQNEDQYNLVKRLLAQTQALKEINMALQCAGESDDYHIQFPVPLASIHSLSHFTLQRLRLDLYVWVADHLPATWRAQYLGLALPSTDNLLERPALLLFTSLTSLKLTIYLYGNAAFLVEWETWRELDALFALPDTLPHLRELIMDIVITPETDSYDWSDGDPVEDAQTLFEDLDPSVFNSKDGCFMNIWKRSKDQGPRNFKFKPSVRVAEQVDIIHLHALG